MELIKHEKKACYNAIVANNKKLFATIGNGAIHLWDTEKLQLICSFSGLQNINNIFWSNNDSLLGGFDNDGRIMIIDIEKKEVILKKKIPNPTKIKHYSDGEHARGFLGENNIYFIADESLGIYDFKDNTVKFFKHLERIIQNMFLIDEKHYISIIYGHGDNNILCDIYFDENYEPSFVINTNFETSFNLSKKFGSDLFLYETTLFKGRLMIYENNITKNFRKKIYDASNNDIELKTGNIDLIDLLSKVSDKNFVKDLKNIGEEILNDCGYLCDILRDKEYYYILFSNQLVVKDVNAMEEVFIKKIKFASKLCFLPNQTLLIGTWKETLFIKM